MWKMSSLSTVSLTWINFCTNKRVQQISATVQTAHYNSAFRQADNPAGPTVMTVFLKEKDKYVIKRMRKITV